MNKAIENRTIAVVLTVEKQGKHNVNKPVKELETTVRKWLEKLLLDPQALENGMKEAKFELQINGKLPVSGRNFFGVQAVNVPEDNPRCLEIIVRPERQQFKWNCRLVCFGKEEEVTAPGIMFLARPGVMQYLDGNLRKFRIEDGVDNMLLAQAREKGDGKKIKEIISHVDKIAQFSKKVRKRVNLQRICLLLDPDENELIDRESLQKTCSKVLGEWVHDGIFPYILSDIVERGIVSPQSEEENCQFIATEFFYALIAEEAELQRKAKLERTQSELLTTQKQLDNARLESKRALDKYNESKNTVESVLSKISEIESRITELST